MNASFWKHSSDTCLDVHDGVDVAGIHFAEGREIQGDVVSEHDRIDVLLEDGIALDLEDVQSYVEARVQSLGCLVYLGNIPVIALLSDVKHCL